MTIIHLDPEQVRATARQLEQLAGQVYDQAQQVSGKVRAIPWSSPGRERYVSQMNRLEKQVQAMAQQGVELSLRVQREVDEWESAAASFGMSAGAGTDARLTPGVKGVANSRKAPKNMKELASLVMEGDGVIRIYKIGENEYLLVVQGTNVKDSNVSNNWGSAITTGMGRESDFQKQVGLSLLGLPAGAVVHMAGHSQGGIVAQNLAASKQITDHIKVGSVTTFGSPVSAAENKNVTYQRYAAKGDIVTYLEGRDAFTALLLAPFIGLPGAVSVALVDRAPQTEISADFSGGPFGPHSEYKNSAALEKITDIPFSIDEKAWDNQPMGYDPGTPRSGLALIQKNLAQGAQAVGSAAQSVTGAADRGVQTAGNFFSNLF